MKALLVVTNHDQLGDTGKKTGWYLPEVAHPFSILTQTGCDVTFVSPKGGNAPLDPASFEAYKDDLISLIFYKEKTTMGLLENTKKPDEVKASDYQLIFYAGGHGAMFDLPNCTAIAKLGAAIYENGGIVGAVGHGTVGLVPIVLSNGKSILKDQMVTSFTNSEETALNLMHVVPFPLETKLVDLGAIFKGAEDFKPNVQVGDRIVTGQNQASSEITAEAIVKSAKSMRLF